MELEVYETLPYSLAQGSTFSPFMHDALYLYARAVQATREANVSIRNGREVVRQAKMITFHGKLAVGTLTFRAMYSIALFDDADDGVIPSTRPVISIIVSVVVK